MTTSCSGRPMAALTGSESPSEPADPLTPEGGLVDNELQLPVHGLDVAGRQRPVPAQNSGERLSLSSTGHHEEHGAGGVEHRERQRQPSWRRLRRVVDGANDRLPLVEGLASRKQRGGMAVFPDTEMDDVA